MKQFIFFIILFSIQFVFANEVQKAIDLFNKNKALENAQISFYVVDLGSSAAVASKNENKLLSPASTMKLFSSAAALEILGAAYKPKTQILYTGEITRDSLLTGDLIVKGFGDASLGSKYFTTVEKRRAFFDVWAAKIKNAGILKIEGKIIADASSFGYFGAPAGWVWGDMGNYYGAFPSGLILFDNILELYFNTGVKAGSSTEIVKTFPEIPGFLIDNYVLSENINSDNSYVFSAPYSNYAFVRGSLPLSKKSFLVKAAIQNPEALFAFEFHEALLKNSIEVAGGYMGKMQQKEQVQGATELFTSHGEKLVEFINLINHKSINLFAEHLACWIALEKSGFGHHDEGIDCIYEHWEKRIEISSARITDASGLSRNNAVSAQQLVQLLAYMERQKNTEFYESLPILGQSGTVKSFCSGQAASGKVRAKSGTMSRIKSYAGYANTKSGKKLAFALIVNNHTNTSSELKNLMEPVMNAMANY
jgi:D-alanyl-D-alanine carboxypeptidase/D-alanyl-D-alanine-endopeptidase (penicillin-binding protein 4)